MSGNGEGREGNNITLTPAQLQAIINEHVQVAVIATHAMITAQGNNRQSGISQSNYRGRLPKCNKCGKHHSGICRKSLRCDRCGKGSHEAKDCWAILPGQRNHPRQNNNNIRGNRVTFGNKRGNRNNNNGQNRNQEAPKGKGDNGICFGCGTQGHIKRDCPQPRSQENDDGNRNGNGNNDNDGNGSNRNGESGSGRAFTMGQDEACINTNDNNGKLILNDFLATVLFVFSAEESFAPSKFARIIDVRPIDLEAKYVMELTDGKLMTRLI